MTKGNRPRLIAYVKAALLRWLGLNPSQSKIPSAIGAVGRFSCGWTRNRENDREMPCLLYAPSMYARL
jgi:hypothetical protein